MKRSPLAHLALLPLLIGVAACTHTSGAGYQAFVKQLRAAGATVVEVSNNGTFPLSGDGHHITVNGGWVEVYEYVTLQDANADAAHISADGSTFRYGNSVSIYDGVLPNHFYKKDVLIVFYTGTDSQVLKLLTNLLGPQFAGG